MDTQLEKFLLEDNLQEINITIKATKSTLEVVDITMDLEKYIELFGYTSEFEASELDVLSEEYLSEEDIENEIEFTKARIAKYDFENSIIIDGLMNVCNILSDCANEEERMMVIDYMTCVTYTEDKTSLTIIQDHLICRDRDELIERLVEDSGIDENSTIFYYVDFDRFADDIIRHDYTETPNGFIFCY